MTIRNKSGIPKVSRFQLSVNFQYLTERESILKVIHLLYIRPYLIERRWITFRMLSVRIFPPLLSIVGYFLYMTALTIERRGGNILTTKFSMTNRFNLFVIENLVCGGCCWSHRR